jgi:uncharacterized protein
LRIYIDKIPQEGIVADEELDSAALDLETGFAKFLKPIKVNAQVYKITDAVSVDLTLHSLIHLVCSRCLNEFEADFTKHLKLNYPVTRQDRVLELDEDIRQEILIDYPLKPLCRPECKGLCPKCGKNLNEGSCSCKL